VINDGPAISMLARVLNMSKVVLAGGAADFWDFLDHSPCII